MYLCNINGQSADGNGCRLTPCGQITKISKEKVCQIFVVWQQLPSVFLSVLTNNHKNTFITNYFIISSKLINR